MKLASWNVNSIKARLEHVRKWLKENQPDVLMIQELKGEEFPLEAFDDMGYHIDFAGQKAYNGVAIFSKKPFKTLSKKLPGDDTDEQARFLEIMLDDIHIINIYAPNGNPVESDKYPYKLNWLRRLKAYLQALRDEDASIIIGGDYNIIPEDIDCHSPKDWEGDALFRPETHKIWRSLLYIGLYDAFRINNQAAEQYSFWDYQKGAWPQNKGIRIDHFLTSPDITDRIKNCEIDTKPRGWEKASDHTPITLEIHDEI